MIAKVRNQKVISCIKKLCNIRPYLPPVFPYFFKNLTLQAAKTPAETNETENPVAEATVDSSGNQNGHGAVDKKKLNKRERKIARQQKNGKTVKATEESASLEPEDDLAGKKKKKDRKRQRSSEQDEDGEKNGAELTKKKKKTCKFNSERLVTS